MLGEISYIKLNAQVSPGIISVRRFCVLVISLFPMKSLMHTCLGWFLLVIASSMFFPPNFTPQHTMKSLKLSIFTEWFTILRKEAQAFLQAFIMGFTVFLL